MNTEDKQLYQDGEDLTERADKLRALGVISFYEWRDLRRKALGMTCPRDHVELTDISQ